MDEPFQGVCVAEESRGPHWRGWRLRRFWKTQKPNDQGLKRGLFFIFFFGLHAPPNMKNDLYVHIKMIFIYATYLIIKNQLQIFSKKNKLFLTVYVFWQNKRVMLFQPKYKTKLYTTTFFFPNQFIKTRTDLRKNTREVQVVSLFYPRIPLLLLKCQQIDCKRTFHKEPCRSCMHGNLLIKPVNVATHRIAIFCWKLCTSSIILYPPM